MTALSGRPGAPRPRRGASLVLLVVLGAALATGAAASLLAGVASSPGAPPTRASEIVVPATWVAGAVLAFLGLLVAVMVYHRLTGGAASLSNRAVLTFFVVVLVGTAFVAAGQFFHPGGCYWCSGSGTGTSGGPPPQNNSTGGTNTSLGGGGQLVVLSWAVPAWVAFLALAVVTVLVAAVAMPSLSEWYADRRLRGSGPRRREPDHSAAEVRKALARATQDLERGDDPRAVIERLYADLLDRLGRLVTEIDPATPEEIRGQHLVRLGIRPEVALDLTRLFEEARYSSHPIGPAAATRASSAIREAISDLDRAPEVA